MLKRILAAIVAALISPILIVWLLDQYGQWLHYWFQVIGVAHDGAVALAIFFVVIAAMILIAAVAWVAVFKEKEIQSWIKTGKFHA